MSDEPEDNPKNPPEDEQALPAPKHFVISPVKDGNYKDHSPTITAVYVGCKEYPPIDDLLRIDGGILDRHDSQETILFLHLFLPPSPDQVSFEETETFAYELSSTKEVINSFCDSMEKIKRFVFVVSTDTYYFSCSINIESNQVTSSTCEMRLLN